MMHGFAMPFLGILCCAGPVELPEGVKEIQTRAITPMIPGLLLSASAILDRAPASNAEDLREAVRTGDVERVKSLLKSGAGVNTRYENQMTPIYFASDPKMVELLVARGARLNLRDSASLQSPIESAAENYFNDEDRRETWKAIVATLRSAGGEYTIDTAVYMNDIASVRERLAKGASWVNKRKGAQSVPLRVAARTGRVEICKLLLEHGADPDDFEQGHGYPIIVDGVQNDAIVKLLIEHKANLRRRITWLAGRMGQWIIGDEASALHFAVSEGNLESVKLLIAAGLDPNAADDEGQTPLHIALKFEKMQGRQGRGGARFADIIAILLDNDASVRFIDRSGKTALDLARTLRSPKEIQQLLQNRRADLDRKHRRATSEDR